MQDDRKKRVKKAEESAKKMGQSIVKSVGTDLQKAKAAASDYFKKPSSSVKPISKNVDLDKVKQIGKSIVKSVGNDLGKMKNVAKKFVSRPDTPLAATPEPKKYQ